jgi:hypothetical protein
MWQVYSRGISGSFAQASPAAASPSVASDLGNRGALTTGKVLVADAAAGAVTGEPEEEEEEDDPDSPFG